MYKKKLSIIILTTILLSGCGAKTYVVDISCLPEFNDNSWRTVHESLTQKYGPYREMTLKGDSNEKITMHLFVNEYNIEENSLYTFKIKHRVKSAFNGEVYVSEEIISIHKDNHLVYQKDSNVKTRDSWIPYRKERYYEEYSWLQK
jgi:hypothetical protein